MYGNNRKQSIGSHRGLKTLHFRVSLEGEAPSILYNSENEEVRLERGANTLVVFLKKPSLRPLAVLGLVPEVHSEDAPIPRLAVVGSPTSSEVKIVIQGCDGAIALNGFTLTLAKLVVNE